MSSKNNDSRSIDSAKAGGDYSLVVENSPFGLALVHEGRLTFANQKFYSVMGWNDPDRAIGQSFPELIHPDDAGPVRSYLSVKGGFERSGLCIIVRPAGTDDPERWIHLRLSPAGTGNSPILVCGVVDVTGQKRIERALRDDRRIYRDLVQGANSVILTFDRQGVITFMNQFGLEFFGYTEQELVGQKTIAAIIPKTDAGDEMDPSGFLDELWANPDAFETNENRNVTKSGRQVWMS